MFKFLQRKEILKDFHEFHKYNVGDRVIVLWDKIERVATVKSISINFNDTELGNPSYYSHNNSVIYYFNEFTGWLGEDAIISKLN